MRVSGRGEVWGRSPQKLTTLFVKIYHFVLGFKNDLVIFAFIAYKCSI